jgi:hypothetical protein
MTFHFGLLFVFRYPLVMSALDRPSTTLGLSSLSNYVGKSLFSGILMIVLRECPVSLAAVCRLLPSTNTI